MRAATDHRATDHPAPTLRLGLALAPIGLVLIGLLPAAAQDPPHWASTSIDIGCTTQCHVPHQAQGGSLTQAASNVDLCQSCHNPAPLALARDLAISDSDKAVRNVTGISHAFDVPARQDFDGDGVDDVLLPQDAAMLDRVLGGNVVCSTCHNQHAAVASMGGHPRVGNAKKVVALTGTGILGTGGIYSGAEGVWYLVEVVTSGDETTAEICYSKDSGISWFPAGCNPPGVTSPNLAATGATPLALDSGVEVVFGVGTYEAGERWEMAASWPFLRAALDVAGDGSRICVDCHRLWNMNTAAVESWNGSPKSHPVGVTFPAANPKFRATPLDGNGEPQGSAGADTNPTNDLQFDGNGQIQCLTCHAVHFVDSNTVSPDGPS